MSSVTKSKYGTYLTEPELNYRKTLVTEWVCCPITNEILNCYEGEIMFISGTDYFISNNGLDKLIGIFGEKFINERIITYD